MGGSHRSRSSRRCAMMGLAGPVPKLCNDAVVLATTKSRAMRQAVVTVGVDLMKSVFEVHVIGAENHLLPGQQLRCVGRVLLILAAVLLRKCASKAAAMTGCPPTARTSRKQRARAICASKIPVASPHTAAVRCPPPPRLRQIAERFELTEVPVHAAPMYPKRADGKAWRSPMTYGGGISKEARCTTCPHLTPAISCSMGHRSR